MSQTSPEVSSETVTKTISAAPGNLATEAEAAGLRDAAGATVTLGWHRRLLQHIPSGQVTRYLGVGAFNTLFGYSVFAILNYVLHRHNVPVSYLFASALSNFINITVAYLAYKFLVFRTRGNYLSEWLKAMAVYWSGFLPSLLLLPTLVRVLNWLLPPHILALHHDLNRRDAAPYLANAVLLAFGVVYSFLGHKNVTFRQTARSGT